MSPSDVPDTTAGINPPVPPHSPQSCIFCRIASGDVPCHAVYRSDRVLAFLDVHPVRPGHVLIIPRDHHAYFDDVPAATATEIMLLGQRMAPLMRSRFAAQKVAFFYTGTDIAHAHAHIVPMVEAGDVTSRRYIREETVTFQQVPRMPDDALAGIANVIVSALQG
ncbi:MAG: HIT family protein [Comamonadaceae bacterium]|nr:MAG: HIT family protein [Comamonadaceae bacterium]